MPRSPFPFSLAYACRGAAGRLSRQCDHSSGVAHAGVPHRLALRRLLVVDELHLVLRVTVLYHLEREAMRCRIGNGVGAGRKAGKREDEENKGGKGIAGREGDEPVTQQSRGEAGRHAAITSGCWPFLPGTCSSTPMGCRPQMVLRVACRYAEKAAGRPDSTASMPCRSMASMDLWMAP